MSGSINIKLLWRIHDFPARRGGNPKGWGVNLLFWAIFPKNLLAGSPLDLPMNCYVRFILWVRSPVIQVEIKLNSSKLHLLAVQSRSIITVTIVMIPVSSLPPANEATGRWCFYPCLSVHGGVGYPCNHCQWCIDPHCTGPLTPHPTPTLDMDPHPGHQTWDPQPYPRC